MKFYLPLIEIAFAFTLVYFLPEGLIRLLKRYLDVRRRPVVDFILQNVSGFLFGSAVALSFLFAFGVSYEDFTANGVRRATDSVRRAVGLDSLSICTRRAKEEFRYTAREFAEAASRFNLFSKLTYSDREHLLSRGNANLITGSFSTVEQLYEQSLIDYCRHK